MSMYHKPTEKTWCGLPFGSATQIQKPVSRGSTRSQKQLQFEFESTQEINSKDDEDWLTR